jgi:hypothetical protein
MKNIDENELNRITEAIKNGTASYRDWGWCYYHVRGWHVMPKLKNKKQTYLFYVTKDNKAEERYSWEFLDKQFEEKKKSIDGVILKTGFVKDANSVTALDYDPRNDPTGKGKEIIDKILATREDILVTESGGNGIHIICEYDESIPNRAIGDTGIEGKNGALLVLPPSLPKPNKKKEGHPYRFRSLNVTLK